MIKKDILLRAFTTVMQQKRIAAIVYLFQLCIALTLGMQAYEVFKASIGHSLEINKLLNGYDHTVITDFLKVHGASITPLIGQLRWLLLVWLLFSIFTEGGLLYTITGKEGHTAQSFWIGGYKCFFPFLKLSLIFLLLAFCWTLVIGLPLVLFLEPALEYFSTEVYTVWAVIGWMLLYLLGLMALFIWSVISRTVQIQTGDGTRKSLKASWVIFSRQIRGFLSLVLSFGLVQLLLLVLYWSLDAWIGMTAPWKILLLFLLQQTFIFLRIQIRQMNYAAVWALSTPQLEKQPEAAT